MALLSGALLSRLFGEQKKAWAELCYLEQGMQDILDMRTKGLQERHVHPQWHRQKGDHGARSLRNFLETGVLIQVTSNLD